MEGRRYDLSEALAKYIDHTLLKPDATKEEINKIIEEAIKYKFASVCVNPHWVSYCSEHLKHTNVKVCTVIGFPLGATTTETKVFEAKKAVRDGATEIDMVINVGELKMKNDSFVREDIQAVVSEAKAHNILTKVIIETALLSDEEIINACKLAKEARADFVKTSTGFSSGGATEEDIKLMRHTVGETIGVKASGGIRDRETANKMIAAGATRIGASASIEIIQM